MKKIVIVEDVAPEADALESLLLSVEENLEIHKTGYAKEAYNFAVNENICLFIIDLQLIDYSGMELAKKIRRLDKHELTPIVFITGNMSRELFAFKTYHCYDYIIKPYNPEQVVFVFTTVLNNVKGDEPVLKIKQRSYVYIIKLQDILYIETLNRKVTIHTDDDIFPVKGKTLTDIHKLLDNSFIRVHNAFIININKVKKIDYSKREIFFEKNNVSVPIGKKRVLKLREKIDDILRINNTDIF